MKSGVNNKKWSMSRFAAVLVICLVSLAVGCEKTFEMDLPLAVTANQLSLTKDAGSTHILIYASGKWSATLTEEVKWASINKLSGEGNADIVFAYAANYGVSRKVGVVFSSGGLRDTVMLTQATAVNEPALNFTDRSATLISAASTVRIPLTTNVQYNVEDMKVAVTYEGDDEDTGDSPTPTELAAENQGWISDISFNATSLTFSVPKYTDIMPRIGYITLSLMDATDEALVTTMLTVTQTSGNPTLTLASDAAVYDGFVQSYIIPAETNLYTYANQIEYTVDYDVPVAEEEEWVKGVSLTSDGLKFALAANEDAVRSATIRMAFTDSEGHSVIASHKITQKVYPKLMSFADLRGKVVGLSGEFTINTENAIECFVISDPASANVCASPQKAQFSFDFEENYKTAYVESTDGKYGFCLKFASKSDNVLKRYSKVRIALKDLVLVKEADPTRYTLKGLTAANVIEAAEPDAALLPNKEKTIAQLNDDDLFTWVSLQDMEIVFKDGCFTNCTDGYSIKTDFNPQGQSSAPRWDMAPLLMTDRNGDVISMLTNAMVPWRRDGKGVPDGSGTFKGVVVAEELVRFGDVGRYQLRAMTRDDIALNNSKFSKTIVEWNWNDLKVDAIPEEGAGTIDLNGAVLTGSSDFNGKLATDSNKGLIPNASIYLDRKWWNFTTDTGEWFDVKFSTAGISGTNLTFGFTWGHGKMNNTTLDSPAHWKMLYSIDGGATFMQVPGAEIIQNRSITWFTTTSQDSCPGYRDLLYNLPQSCFGQQEVIVRLQVADKVTDISPGTAAATYLQNLGIEKGTLTDKSTHIRLGALTVRYN